MSLELRSQAKTLETLCNYVIGGNATNSASGNKSFNRYSEDHTLNRILAGPAVALAFVAAATPAVYAAHQTSLMQAAAQLGYAYSYLGPEDAVALTKPGVTIVIRPGERLFDVNDRTEAMEGSAPRFSDSDIYISDAFLARLRTISAKYPSSGSGDRAIVVQNGPYSASATGSISDLTLVQVPGKQQLLVSGKAPGNLPITLTLVGTLSQDIPDTIISRNEVVSDADGRFKLEVSPAPAWYYRTILTLVASSVPGVSTAKATIVLTPPNGAHAIGNDVTPRQAR